MSAEQIKEFCGVMGVWGDDNAAEMVFHGLYSLQHRGQESAGIVASDGKNFRHRLGMGVLTTVFNTPEKIHELEGRAAIGHTRYSTTGSSSPFNIQPFSVMLSDGPVALAHNGNLVNTGPIHDRLQEHGAIFQSTTDSEIVIHLMAHSHEKGLTNKLIDAVKQVQGAFSMVMLTRDAMYAIRDPHGFRPLCIGEKNGSIVFVSESCALDLLGYEYVRDVEPGEIVVADKDGWRGIRYADEIERHHCIFELIYFSRPDSRIFGEYVDKSRRKMGKQLYRDHPADADIVISVPDSSNTAALGYSLESGLRFELGLIRNHYVGRTFIQPTPAMREMGVKLKFNAVGGVLKDKRVVVVEDSIVRGTTLRKLADLLRAHGAKEVHVRVSSPPIRFPCYYGMDFPTREELIAHERTVEDIRELIHVDTLGYLSVDGLLESVRRSEGQGYCTACFTGNYPVPIEEDQMNGKSRHEC